MGARGEGGIRFDRFWSFFVVGVYSFIPTYLYMNLSKGLD